MSVRQFPAGLYVSCVLVLLEEALAGRRVSLAEPSSWGVSAGAGGAFLLPGHCCSRQNSGPGGHRGVFSWAEPSSGGGGACPQASAVLFRCQCMWVLGGALDPGLPQGRPFRGGALFIRRRPRRRSDVFKKSLVRLAPLMDLVLPAKSRDAVGVVVGCVLSKNRPIVVPTTGSAFAWPGWFQ